MTGREDRTRILLEAAARDHHVDTTGLWERVEPQLAAIDHRPRSRPGLAVAAAAVVTLGVVGTAVWASGWGDRTSPVPAASSSGVVSTTTTPETSTTAPPSTSAYTSTTSLPSSLPPPTTSGSPVTPALSSTSLLVAADYEAAGWPVSSVKTSTGWGQSPISTCQHELPPTSQREFPEPLRADAYPAAPDLGLAAHQYTFEFGTSATASDVLDTVLAWPNGCGARTGQTVSSSAPWTHGRSDGSEGYWYTMSFEPPDGTRHTELVVLARAADRLSVMVLHEQGDATVVGRVDASVLVDRALTRLG